MPDLTETWIIGATRLTTIVEAETHGVPVGLFYPEAGAADVDAAASWLPAGMADGRGGITFRVKAFVVEHAGHTILVDPCVGNHNAFIAGNAVTPAV